MSGRRGGTCGGAREGIKGSMVGKGGRERKGRGREGRRYVREGKGRSLWWGKRRK